MNDVGKHVRKISLLAALLGALALVVPVAAGAQALDPVLEQYAPSTQQINNKVKGDKPDQSDGGGSSDAEGGDGGAVAGTGSDDDAGSSGDSGSAGGSESAGGSGAGSSAGADSGGGSGASSAHNGPENSSAAEETGLDTRVLSGLPITRLDFLVIALALGALVVAAVMLRRLTRSFETGS